ncbi:hypothetical protein GQ457_04G018240 [Hibiscus cannabinus]
MGVPSREETASSKIRFLKAFGCSQIRYEIDTLQIRFRLQAFEMLVLILTLVSSGGGIGMHFRVEFNVFAKTFVYDVNNFRTSVFWFPLSIPIMCTSIWVPKGLSTSSNKDDIEKWIPNGDKLCASNVYRSKAIWIPKSL